LYILYNFGNFTENTKKMRKKFTQKQIHILEIAEKLIARKGYEGTSVRDISSAAKINVAMISYYFGSKEKMMASLYQYRVQKTRESFAEFAETIKEGKAEMQIKELLKFVIARLFKYKYFHGFVTQELRHTEHLKKELTDFYSTFTLRIDEVIKKGVASGVFSNAPMPEDVLTIILGSAIFVIRNKDFYELYVPGTEENYDQEVVKKTTANLLITVFTLLGYNADY